MVKLRQCISDLPLIEKEVFEERYGLNDNKSAYWDLSDAAEYYRMPVENLKRILERAWMRLRRAGFEQDEQWLLALQARDRELG